MADSSRRSSGVGGNRNATQRMEAKLFKDENHVIRHHVTMYHVTFIHVTKVHVTVSDFLFASKSPRLYPAFPSPQNRSLYALLPSFARNRVKFTLRVNLWPAKHVNRTNRGSLLARGEVVFILLGEYFGQSEAQRPASVAMHEHIASRRRRHRRWPNQGSKPPSVHRFAFLTPNWKLILRPLYYRSASPGQCGGIHLLIAKRHVSRIVPKNPGASHFSPRPERWVPARVLNTHD